MPQKVSEIIDSREKEWRIDAIKEYILGEQKQAIKAIHISKTGGKDKIVWPYIVDGGYTEKIGNHELKNKKDMG